jgi:hypothetical protein
LSGYQLNRANSEQHEQQSEKEGLEPTKQRAADLFNEIISREFSSDDIEFAWAEEEDIDPEKQSKILTGYVDAGVISVNEARERLGEEPSADPPASVLAVKTATGRVPISGAAKINSTEEVQR